MIITILNIVVSIAMTIFIGYSIRLRQFPFNGFNPHGVGPWGWLNFIFIFYNSAIAISTWLTLGPLSIRGIVYLVSILVLLYIGYAFDTIKAKWYEIREYGLIRTIKTSYYNFRLKQNNKREEND